MSRRALLLPIFLGLMLGTGNAQSNQPLLEDGLRALRADDFARAQQYFALLVKQDPSGTNFGYLAIAEASSGNVDQAIAHFRQAIRLGNSSPRIHYNLGVAYLQWHESTTEAIRELKLAIAKDPEFVPAQHALGVALVDLGRPKEAILYF
jgi:tetratricopeptide (TPR) repeat protein